MPGVPFKKAKPGTCARVVFFFFLLVVFSVAGAAPILAQDNNFKGLSARFRDEARLARPRTSNSQPANRRRGPRPLPIDLARKIVSIAISEGVDHMLVLEMMRQESGFNTGARSGKGAAGLMQFIPATARRFGINDPHNPDEAIRGACKYIKHLAGLFDNRIDLILAGYNAGEGAVRKYGNKVPPYPETQNYVTSILAGYRRAKQLQAAVRAKPSSPQVAASPGSNAWHGQPVSKEQLSDLGRIPRMGTSRRNNSN